MLVHTNYRQQLTNNYKVLAISDVYTVKTLERDPGVVLKYKTQNDHALVVRFRNTCSFVDDQPQLRVSGVVVTLVCECTRDPERFEEFSNQS